MIQLSNPLTIALGQYFLNRHRANKQHVGSTYTNGVTVEQWRSGHKWDKAADLERIFSTLPKGWSAQAVAGSFWFTNPKEKGRHFFLNEDTWPLARVNANS